MLTRPDNGKPAKGAIAWRGPSPVDGSPILLVVLWSRSKNRKTGAMAQTYILPDPDAMAGTPADWARAGADVSVCGNCPLRPALAGPGEPRCYVTLAHGPGSVVRGIRRRIYPDATPEQIAPALTGRVLRAGTYGDPAMVPASVWRPLLAASVAWTGYTHQWRQPWAAEHRTFCMASTGTDADRAEALAAGWRSFRVRQSVEPVDRSEVVCPASAEAGARVQCAACKLCGGTSTPAKSVVIVDHGPTAR